MLKFKLLLEDDPRQPELCIVDLSGFEHPTPVRCHILMSLQGERKLKRTSTSASNDMQLQSYAQGSSAKSSNSSGGLLTESRLESLVQDCNDHTLASLKRLLLSLDALSPNVEIDSRTAMLFYNHLRASEYVVVHAFVRPEPEHLLQTRSTIAFCQQFTETLLSL